MGALATKLRIREGAVLRVINPPAAFQESLGELPPGVKLTSTAKGFSQVHWFVKDKAQLDKEIDQVLNLVQGDVIAWVYFPKGSSGIQTDLNRDKGWEAIQHRDLQWLNLVSFDATWSAFAVRQKTESDRKKESAKPAQREIYQYADSKTKTIIVPEDLQKAFKKHKAEAAYFHALAFSHRREYVEWIISAKREETRAKRVTETIERLGKQWKNPANR